MSAAQSFLPVAIVGGGPAGLTLARVLQMHGVACRVYENEPAANARDQGGSLDLHAENGLWALEQCQLIDAFNRHSRPEGDCMRIMDKAGRVYYSEEPAPRAEEAVAPGQTPSGRPEIDRLALRNILLDSLEPGTVQWGHALSHMQPLPATADDDVPRWELTFKSGAKERAAVVVGADGAWSRIRPVLSSTVPSYTGYTAIDLMVPNVSARHPQLTELVGQGTCFILDDERGFIAQRNGADVLRVYAVLKVDEGWAEDEDGGAYLANADSEAIVALIEGNFSGWYEPALQLLHCADIDSLRVRRMYQLPFSHTFQHTAHTRLVTAVGDAAHVMSINGEGVNLAMMDAAQLALALSPLLSQPSPQSTPSTLCEQLAAAIDGCERSMFARSSALQDDPFNFQLFFSQNGAERFASTLREVMAGGGVQGDAGGHEQSHHRVVDS